MTILDTEMTAVGLRKFEKIRRGCRKKLGCFLEHYEIRRRLALAAVLKSRLRPLSNHLDMLDLKYDLTML